MILVQAVVVHCPVMFLASDMVGVVVGAVDQGGGWSRLEKMPCLLDRMCGQVVVEEARN